MSGCFNTFNGHVTVNQAKCSKPSHADIKEFEAEVY